MIAIALAVLLAFSPQGGTVYTTDGGRLRGTIVDAGADGVTVQLADGSTRKVAAGRVSRVDFADGTSWKPGAAPAAAAAAVPAAAAPASQAAAAAPAPSTAPAAAPPSPPVAAATSAAAAPQAVAPNAQPVATSPPVAAAVATPAAVVPPPSVGAATAASPAPAAQAAAPVAAPVLAVAAAPAVAPTPAAAAAAPAAEPGFVASRPGPMAIPADRLDTIHVARGNRLRCLVIEEGPDGVVVRLVDGTERRYAPGQVIRIDWADGTHSDLSAPPPAPGGGASASR